MAHRKLIISLDKDSINNPPIVLRQGESGLQAYDIEFMLDGTTLVIKDTDVVSFRGTTPAETYVSELCTVKSGLVTFTPKAATSAVGNYKIAYFSVNDIFGSGNNINVNVLEQADATAEQADVYVGEVTKLINDLTIKTSATIKDLTDKSAAAIKQLTDEQTALNTKIDTSNKTLTDNIAASQKLLTDNIETAKKALDTAVSTANKTLTDAMALLNKSVSDAQVKMNQLKNDLAASDIQKYKLTGDNGSTKAWTADNVGDITKFFTGVRVGQFALSAVDVARMTDKAGIPAAYQNTYFLAEFISAGPEDTMATLSPRIPVNDAISIVKIWYNCKNGIILRTEFHSSDVQNEAKYQPIVPDSTWIKGTLGAGVTGTIDSKIIDLGAVKMVAIEVNVKVPAKQPDGFKIGNLGIGTYGRKTIVPVTTTATTTPVTERLEIEENGDLDVWSINQNASNIYASGTFVIGGVG